MRVLAVCCSDIHLSLEAPVARSAETDWLAAQGRALSQVRALADEHGCPVIYAGDVFDRPDPRPELVNWAIANLPGGYAVPGQHDLMCHRYEDVRKTAYWTLGEAGVLTDLGAAGDWTVDGAGRVVMYPFPWGRDLRPASPVGKGLDKLLKVAVVHRYVWMYETHAGTSDGTHHSSYRGSLAGYGVAVFGDNHGGFQVNNIYNCGCLIRRKRNERELKPAVGLLMEDGTVERHHLDVSEDLWADVDPAVERLAEDDPRLEAFVRELVEMSVDSLDFREAIRRYVRDNKVRLAVEAELLEGL